MLCSTALSKYHLQKKFKIKGETDYRIDEESVMDFQYDAGYGIVQSMDFGGMMPLEGASTVTPRFLQLNTFVGLRSIMLPVMFRIQNKTTSFPPSSSLILKDEWGMSKCLYGRSKSDKCDFPWANVVGERASQERDSGGPE